MTWIAIATFADHYPGVPLKHVRVIATEGGSRAVRARRRSFIVPAAEYKAAPKSFVVDTTKYQEEL